MWKLRRFLKPSLYALILVLVLVFAQAMTELFLPSLMSDIINTGVMAGKIDVILDLGARMILVTTASLACAFGANILAARIAAALGRDLRLEVFRKVEHFSLREFDKFGTATLITRTSNDVTQVQNVMVMILRMMLMAPVMAIGGIVMASAQDGPLALVFAVALPVLVLAVILLARKVMPLFASMQERVDRLNLVLRENLAGARVIRAFRREAHEAARFEAANADITQTYIRANRIMAFMMPTLMLIMNGTGLAVFWFGVQRIDTGGMPLGSLFAFTQYTMQIMFSFVMFAMMFIMIPRAQAAARRINEVLEEAADAAMTDGSTVAHGTLRGDIEFRDLCFTYHGAEQPALRNISFHARPGQMTAIIGSTGSGKSTLLKLILRFYDADSGRILLDGVDLRDYAMADLRARMGYVPQTAVLFSGSIRDNLQFGNEAADDAALLAALATAQAQEYVDGLEQGLDHRLDQGGVNASGGQKQRLSIARALARQAEIYLLDDSFSALDFKTDAALRRALRARLDGATVLLVAQRVGTVRDADQIIVLDEGGIAGVGTHRDLLENCTVYREIAASQLSMEELA